MRLIGHLRFSIIITHRFATQSMEYQEHWTYFDQFRLVTCGALVDPHPLSPWSAFAAYLPLRPATPATCADVKSDPNCEYWYNAVMERYTKNHHIGLWSIPIAWSSLPPSANILPAVSKFKVKHTDSPSIWEFYFWLCANGSCQLQGREFDQSHSPVATYVHFCMMCALAAALVSEFMPLAWIMLSSVLQRKIPRQILQFISLFCLCIWLGSRHVSPISNLMVLALLSSNVSNSCMVLSLLVDLSILW